MLLAVAFISEISLPTSSPDLRMKSPLNKFRPLLIILFRCVEILKLFIPLYWIIKGACTPLSRKALL
jgi:hypothetical protein